MPLDPQARVLLDQLTAAGDRTVADMTVDEARQTFEERRWRDLGTWEAATKVAEDAAAELTNFLGPRAGKATTRFRKGPPADAPR